MGETKSTSKDLRLVEMGSARKVKSSGVGEISGHLVRATLSQKDKVTPTSLKYRRERDEGGGLVTKE